MTPLAIVLLVTLIVLLLGAVWTPADPRTALGIAAAMVAIVFVMTMMKVR